MRLTFCILVAFVCSGHYAVAQDGSADGAIPVPLTRERWTFQRLYRRDQTSDTNPRFESHLGRTSLFLPNGFALASGVALKNGTLEADVATYEGGALFGLAFHVATSPDQYEIVFFRPHSPDGTVQYAPSFFHMNAWQFFAGPDHVASLDFPQDRWVHLRVVIKGLVASVYVDTASTPTIQIHDLTLGSVSGTVGFWARAGGGFISNVRYRPDTTSYSSRPEHGFPPGAITQGWALSDASVVAERNPETYPDVRALHWEAVQAEGDGKVLVGRYRHDPNEEAPRRLLDRPAPATPGTQVVFARTTLVSARDTVRKMWIGYSDDVVVFLNGRPLYAGRNSMSYRDPGALGYVYPYADAVFLPLRKGPNELLLAVSEATAGWGFICRLDPP